MAPAKRKSGALIRTAAQKKRDREGESIRKALVKWAGKTKDAGEFRARQTALLDTYAGEFARMAPVAKRVRRATNKYRGVGKQLSTLMKGAVADKIRAPHTETRKKLVEKRWADLQAALQQLDELVGDVNMKITDLQKRNTNGEKAVASLHKGVTADRAKLTAYLASAVHASGGGAGAATRVRGSSTLVFNTFQEFQRQRATRTAPKKKAARVAAADRDIAAQLEGQDADDADDVDGDGVTGRVHLASSSSSAPDSNDGATDDEDDDDDDDDL